MKRNELAGFQKDLETLGQFVLVCFCKEANTQLQGMRTEQKETEVTSEKAPRRKD